MAPTKGPWLRDGNTIYALHGAGSERRNRFTAHVQMDPSARQFEEEAEANACLMAGALGMLATMKGYLPIIEALEASPRVWARFAAGTGIATANGYRAAIAKAEGRKP